MKFLGLFAAGMLAAASLATPASAQHGYQGSQWNQGYHHDSRRHWNDRHRHRHDRRWHRQRVCKMVWRHHHRVRRCYWR